MQNLVTLRGNVHPLARPEFDQGVAPDDLPLERMQLVLQRGSDQETALRQLLDDQQVKSSARFHQWLTPEEFGQQFGPADSDVQAVTGWLASQGFVVTKVAAGRTVIEFSGTAGLARQVLGTEIHRFRVDGADHWANTSDPQIPAALEPVVAGFASLNNFPRKPTTHTLGTFSRSKLTGKVQPSFTVTVPCNSSSGCYYFPLGPADFATIYNVFPLWNASTPTDGTGQTIAVVGETNINPQDVADFRSMFGLPANAPNIILNGPDPGIIGDETEADLDVQWSGAVAKGATIDLVVSESTETTHGIDLSALYIIDNNLAPIMSESYSVCEAYLGTGGNQFHSTLWEQAAAQGISVLLSSADSGSAGCDSANSGETAAQYGLGVSGLASTPFNVAVGGTDFNVDDSNFLSYWNLTNNSAQASAISYIPEIPWNDSCAASGSLTGCTPPPNTTLFNDGYDLVAGSGGPSSCTNSSGVFPNVTCGGSYPKPSWQSGAGVPNDGARDIPDVSLFAGDGLHSSFYVICQMDANSRGGGNASSCDLNAPYTDFQAGGGTSAAVQVFAGIMAMVNQRHGRQGNANYVLYPMAAQSGATCNTSTAPLTNSNCIFYDLTTGNNSVICQGGSPNCSNATSGQYGIMVSGSPASAAYPATFGYDMATGLGSVNVANLVNNWKSNFTPSTASLSLATNPVANPISLTHGQPINFTVNVTSGNGTPTGDASLIAQTGSASSNQTGIGPFTLSGGSVSGSTIMLPGGSYNVTAHYAGNGTFAASDSSPGIPVTVGKESSQAKISLVTFDSNGNITSTNASSAPYGSFYILRMDVTNGGGQLCSPAGSNNTQYALTYACPTGTVTVTPAPTDQNPPSGTVAGQYKLNSQGYAEEQPIQQPGGTYNFVASYGGDNSYTGSTSSTVPITVTKATTTTTLTGPSQQALAGLQFGIGVVVSTQSSGLAPSAGLQLFNGNTAIPVGVDYSQVNGSSAGYASLTMGTELNLPAGTVTLTAQYPGDTNYASSTSSPLTINIEDFTPSSTPSSLNISAPGQSATAAITVTSVNGFAGTVSLGVPGVWCPSGVGTYGVGMTCTISPSSVTVTGTTPGQATLTVTTTAASSTAPPITVPRQPPGFRTPSGFWWAFAGILTIIALLTFARARRRAAGWLFATALLVMGLWAACGSGGGGSSPTSPSGPVPIAGLGPTSLTFNPQVVNTTSIAQYVSLNDAGQAMLNISSIAIVGPNAADFAQTNNCPVSLASSNFCEIDVTFTPTASGARSTSLVVTDNASGSPQSVTLTGTGSQPVLNISPTTLAFGQQVEYTQSAPQTVTLSNPTASSVTFSNLGELQGPSADNFGTTSTCGSSLVAGATCTVAVVFQPMGTGLRSDSLLFTIVGSTTNQTVSVSGTGILPTTAPGNYTVSVQVLASGDSHTLNIPVTVQ